MLRRFDGFCGFFSESLNPNRLNPNQFADFCGFLRNFKDVCVFVAELLRNVADVCGIVRIFAECLRNVAEFSRNFRGMLRILLRKFADKH